MKVRRYELDWLRVLVFGLLIFYHVCMYFNPWWWHIKSPITYDWMEIPLLLLNQWRLEILFIISGMGTYFSLKKRSKSQYAKERFWRLAIPLWVGMLLIIPPQVYIERVTNDGLNLSYWEYFTTIAFEGFYPVGNITWNHLWFLPYLLSYSLLLIPLIPIIKSERFQQWLNKLEATWTNNPWSIFFFIIPIIIVEATLSPFFPVMPTLIGDWYALTHYFLLFFFGFLFMQISQAFFTTCTLIRRKLLFVAIMAFGIQILSFKYLHTMKLADIVQSIFEIVYMWSIILAIFGYATMYLSKNAKPLKYLNEAVYPFYIFHQTVLIIAIYQFKDYFNNDLAFFFFLMCITILGSWVLFELVRRISILRPLFGLKGQFQKSTEIYNKKSYSKWNSFLKRLKLN